MGLDGLSELTTASISISKISRKPVQQDAKEISSSDGPRIL